MIADTATRATAVGGVNATDFALEALDGRMLAATLHRPEDAPMAALVIAAATGVPRQCYRRFATWLADHGYAVLTFDYRGLHGSRDRPLRSDPARVSEWGTQDLAGAIARLADDYPSLPRIGIGHSIGGQLIGLASTNMRLDGAIGIATQSGYWRHWPASGAPLRLWRWYVKQPLLAHLLGYYPGKRDYSTDLPKGVAVEFARWCRSPDYIVDDHGRPIREHFLGFARPYRFVSFTDDSVAPLPATRVLMGMYAGADTRLERVDPHALGLAAIGHFGFFREAAREALWPLALDWLAAATSERDKQQRSKAA